MSESEKKLLLSIREKIIAGLPLAFQKMWEEAKQTNRELVFSKNGKIVTVKANEYKP